MAIITRADGTTENVGESIGEFQSRMQAQRIATRGLTPSETKSLGAEGAAQLKAQETAISKLPVSEQQTIFATGKFYQGEGGRVSASPISQQDNRPMSTAFAGPRLPEAYNRFEQQKSFVSIKEDKEVNKVQNVMNQLFGYAQERKQGQEKLSELIRESNKNPVKQSFTEKQLSNLKSLSSLPIKTIQESKAYKTSDKFVEKAIGNIQSFKELQYQERGDVLKEFNKPINIEKGESGLTTFTKFAKSDLKLLKGLSKTEGKQAFAGLASTGGLILNTPLHPVKTVKGFAGQLIHPIDTLTELGSELKKNPVGTLTELYASGKVIHEVSKPLKYTAPVEKIRREIFIAKQPVELRPITRAILESEKAQRGVTPVDINTLKGVNLYDIKNLKGVEPKLFEKTIRETGGITFGSKAARVLSGGETRLPKDIDVAVKDVKSFNVKFVKSLPKNLREQFVIKNQKILRASDKTTLADVKPLERLRPDKSLLTGVGSLPIAGFSDKITLFAEGKPTLSFKSKLVQGLYDIPTQRIKTVEGLKFVSFSEQTSRKALGSLQYLIEKNIKREKDLPDYVSYLKIQEKAMTKTEGLNPKSLKFKKLIRSIEKESKKVKVTSSKISNLERISESRLPSSRLPYALSRLPVSRLPSSRLPVTPSRMPSSKISKLPSSLFKPSKTPSRTLINPLSKIPSSISKTPSSTVSTLRSSNVSSLSSLPSSLMPSTSKQPMSSLIPFSRLPVKDVFKNQLPNIQEMFKRKKKRKGKTTGRKTYFTPTLIGSGKASKRKIYYIGGEAR